MTRRPPAPPPLRSQTPPTQRAPSPAPWHPLQRARGFTLVEVLVALGMVALALLAGLRASAALSDNAERQTRVLLARLCAENELMRLRLARQMPGVGIQASRCEQAGYNFELVLTVQGTPNPNFLRAEAQVRDSQATILQLSTVLGRY